MTPRTRQWLEAVVVFGLVLAIVIAWSGFLYARTVPHYRQTQPGESSMIGDTRTTLVSLTRSATLPTDRDDNPAPAGTVWVIAEVEVVGAPEFTRCTFNLLGADGRVWLAASALTWKGRRTLEAWCTKVKPGERKRVEFVYLIPAQAGDELAGLTTYPERGLAPQPVLTPPE